MGVIVNTLAIIVGSLLGVGLNAGISKKISDTIMKGIGLVVLIIGISGALTGERTIVMVVSIVAGACLGEWIDIDHFFKLAVQKIESKFIRKNTSSTFGQGFVTATLLFCVGSMAIIGSLEGGLVQDHSTLYTKSVLDGITATILASTLGIGVMFSSAPVFIWQGSIFLLAGVLQPFLSPEVITEVIATGSILLIGLGLNMLEITELKILNYMPAMFFPAIILVFV